MIESIEFKNFKVLRDTTLPLGPCNVLVGPNGSGKTTVLQALEAVRDETGRCSDFLSMRVARTQDSYAEVALVWGDPQRGVRQFWRWRQAGGIERGTQLPESMQTWNPAAEYAIVKGLRVFSFDARAIAAPATVTGRPELDANGGKLAAVLDGLRDEAIERFDAINAELNRWLPEFDRILFDRPADGSKSIALRTSEGHHKVPASALSQGTLISLAILTLAYLPEPPLVVGLEEPDRGIHPRLLRRVKDALHRLSHPESCGEKRDPVQVIATTHSPYFLDLFKDHPEKIVICERVGQEVQFKRVSDLPHIEEILGDAPLGEAWYTGILGGVPSEP
ncbi:MAG TPA: AAA family ATPase [Thermoguttaceae bacterium]|nr:AAA family ATPase [Thermoguttaceae bacterium]